MIDKLNGPGSKIETRFSTAITAFEGRDSKLQAVHTRNLKTGQEEVLNPAAVFVFIGQRPNSEFLKDYLHQDPYGYILTGRDLAPGLASGMKREPYAFETSQPEVFAAGDVRHGSTKQVGDDETKRERTF